MEDPRITRLGDTFYMVYCGVEPEPAGGYRVRLCMARSADLLHWTKHGPLPGDVARCNNKDRVLLPGPIAGRYYLLHRPAPPGAAQAELAIHLAAAGDPTGPWQDLGTVLGARPNPAVRSSWVGAGSVPIALHAAPGQEARRFLAIYHTGNYLNDLDREYDLDAAIFDFDRLDPAHPTSIVTARLEHLMAPETPAELRSPSRLQVANVLFACGSYEYRDDIYIIYGGADTYTLAARVNRAALLATLTAESQ